jgi:hypothetical protein
MSLNLETVLANPFPEKSSHEKKLEIGSVHSDIKDVSAQSIFHLEGVLCPTSMGIFSRIRVYDIKRA